MKLQPIGDQHHGHLIFGALQCEEVRVVVADEELKIKIDRLLSVQDRGQAVDSLLKIVVNLHVVLLKHHKPGVTLG